jgi:hypothetical protein
VGEKQGRCSSQTQLYIDGKQVLKDERSGNMDQALQ